MILPFTTETAYLSLKLVGSFSQRRYIHQVLASIYFDSDGNHEYRL